MKSIDQIAEDAARTVLVQNFLAQSSPDPILDLGFSLGDGISYEEGLMQIVSRAIEIDRAQREDA